MNRSICSTLLFLLFGAGVARPQQVRPVITGISHMCVFAHDMAASADFYGRVLGGTKGPDLQDPNGVRFYFSPTQFVEVLPLPANAGLSRMACVAWNTSDARALHRYMQAKSVENLSELKSSDDGSRWFSVNDPEGNVVKFVQPGKADLSLNGTKPISHRMIHVGYAVKDRAVEDHFYREILGFRPYWYGSMKPNHMDWVSQQVPDGHDWLEYMMTGDGSDVDAAKVDARELGVLNHFSLGVSNMEAAVTMLVRDDRLSPRHDGPQLGRDGKWQANLYDPDGTRVELMEFQPVTKPCCSDFTASSPVR
jgi:catechol 2,3-dioxygenase-like lactoylglutathione lyase family enzyme